MMGFTTHIFIHYIIAIYIYIYTYIKASHTCFKSVGEHSTLGFPAQNKVRYELSG